MVLTAEEVVRAQALASTDSRVRSAHWARRTTKDFVTQCCNDREIQRYLQTSKQSPVYRFNCNVIHQPWKFVEISALSDHGWDGDGPTNEEIRRIYRTLPVCPSNNRNAATTGSLLPVNNLSKEDGNMNDIPLIDKGVMDKPRYLYDDDEDSAKSGCFWNFFSCICS